MILPSPMDVTMGILLGDLSMSEMLGLSPLTNIHIDPSLESLFDVIRKLFKRTLSTKFQDLKCYHLAIVRLFKARLLKVMLSLPWSMLANLINILEELLLTARDLGSIMPSLLLDKPKRTSGLLEIHGAKVGGTMAILLWGMEILVAYALMLLFQFSIFKMGKLSPTTLKMIRPKIKKINDWILFHLIVLLFY